MTDLQSPSGRQQQLSAAGGHLAALESLLKSGLDVHVGEGLARELSHVIAAFRQRHPTCWPGSQQQLL
jgi:hypothetical protein